MNENPLGSINKWQRLFRAQGLRFLINDIWMEHYKTLGALTIVINDEYTSYFPHKMMRRTLTEGAELISDIKRFERYIKEFRAYMNELRIYVASISFDDATKKEISRLLNKIAQLFFYYSKTEFFYTDGAYKLFEEKKDKRLGERLKRMGQIKKDGRTLLNSLFFGAEAALSKLLKSLEQRFDIPERILQQYSRKEIINLFDNKRVANNEIERRSDAFYIIGKDGGAIIKTGTGAKKQIRAFIGRSVRGYNKMIKGLSANMGKTRGVARIIRTGYDNFDALHRLMDAMQKGDILVAETTSPELLPACQKAGAIITNQGGMLSHAAIISRELNIPCIVGTGNATEMIKNGDLVEVDAEKGLIRIMKTAK